MPIYSTNEKGVSTLHFRTVEGKVEMGLRIESSDFASRGGSGSIFRPVHRIDIIMLVQRTLVNTHTSNVSGYPCPANDILIPVPFSVPKY
jgi:hypothetical protein